MWLQSLASSDPLSVWGLLSRGIGLVFLIAFVSLFVQIVPIAGVRGITPARDAFAAIKRDFPGWRRFVYFPSLLWFGTSDRVLRGWLIAGMVAATSVVVGGPWSPWATFACYVIYLAFDRPMSLAYPWDCVLYEAGFWGTFLPATHVLPDLRALEAPLPALAWVFRLLVFRVMFGFGKQKFVGTTLDDRGYLKSFLLFVPLTNRIGWLAHKLPLWCHSLGLALLFTVEILLPFSVFAPPWSAVGALGVICLMLGIWLLNSFAFFNLILIVLALSWLDAETAQAPLWDARGPMPLYALIVLHTLGALVSLMFNTFCANTWFLWPIWLHARSRVLRSLVTTLRVLHPLRWLHGYGVFPPRSFPPAKFVPVLEASWDDNVWHTIELPHAPSVETSLPRFCAPHWLRIDQMATWEASGLCESSILRNLAGRFDPYGYGGASGLQLLLHRIVCGDVPGDALYDRSLERRLGAPRRVRARVHMFQPTEWVELKRTGKWWRRTLVGPHAPPMSREDGYWEHPLPPPELWHFNELCWIRRSTLGQLMRRASRGEDPHALVRELGIGLADDEPELYWTRFLPEVCSRPRHDWTGMRRTVQRLRASYDAAQLYRFERLSARYALFLFARLEELFLSQTSVFELRLLCAHILGEGRAAYDAVLRDPHAAFAHARHVTPGSGYYFQALFRYEQCQFQSQKLRMMGHCEPQPPRALESDEQRYGRFGAQLGKQLGLLGIFSFLKSQFLDPDDMLDTPERWPRFIVRASGEAAWLPTIGDEVEPA